MTYRLLLGRDRVRKGHLETEGGCEARGRGGGGRETENERERKRGWG